MLTACPGEKRDNALEENMVKVLSLLEYLNSLTYL